MIKGDLIGVGQTAEVYAWGKHEVIKIFHDRHLAEAEAKNAEILDSLGLRLPRYSGLVEYEGRLCIVYERIDGPTMLRQIEPTVEGISRNARMMAQLHVEIHQAPLPFDSNLKAALARKINQTHDIADPDKHTLVGNLNTLPEGRTLCHYDFHPDNIIMSPNGPVIIDWMNALVGHLAADVARTVMILQSHALPPQTPGWLQNQNRQFRERFLDEYFHRYLELSEMDPEELKPWMAPTLAVRISELRGEERREIVNRLREALHSEENRK